jgi:hypothetical protein
MCCSGGCSIVSMAGIDAAIRAVERGQILSGKGRPYRHVSWFTRNGVDPRDKPDDDKDYIYGGDDRHQYSPALSTLKW